MRLFGIGIFFLFIICVAGSCPRLMFDCGDDRRCIVPGWKCDGILDCSDGSDEAECDTTEGASHEHQFVLASSSELIPIRNLLLITSLGHFYAHCL